MKAVTYLSLLGAASATYAPAQQPLSLPKVTPESWRKPLENLQESLNGLSAEARKVWDEVEMMFPKSFDQANFFSQPKPHTRRADSEWDHIMKGEDIQKVWVENAKGEKERDIDGKLSNYNLRTKSVDPKALGVDTVKQYSGYLDDEEEDKHNFQPTGHKEDREREKHCREHKHRHDKQCRKDKYGHYFLPKFLQALV